MKWAMKILNGKSNAEFHLVGIRIGWFWIYLGHILLCIYKLFIRVYPKNVSISRKHIFLVTTSYKGKHMVCGAHNNTLYKVKTKHNHLITYIRWTYISKKIKKEEGERREGGYLVKTIFKRHKKHSCPTGFTHFAFHLQEFELDGGSSQRHATPLLS